MKARLLPLPRKAASLDDNHGATSKAALGMGLGLKEQVRVVSGGRNLIEPRRMALKFDTSTLVIEYKDFESGKLRHRSFHIDTNLFQDANACVDKLSRKLSKVVVPGSIPKEQLHRLVDKLWQHTADLDPDLDELEAATNAFMERHRSPEKENNAFPFDSDSNIQKNTDGALVKKTLTALPRISAPIQTITTEEAPKEEIKKEQEGKNSDAVRPKEEGRLQAVVDTFVTQEAPSPVRLEPVIKVSSPTADSVPDEVEDYVEDFEDAEESPDKESASKSAGKHLDESDDDGVHHGKGEQKRLAGDDIDLNHVDAEELDEYKRLMNINFEKNAIKPGDPRYKHDVQVDFDDPEEDCGWDEEDVSGDVDFDDDIDPFLP